MKSKFEIEIKNKLENRTLQPTDTSWDKIQDLMRTQKNNTNKGLKISFWIAATFLLIGGLLFVFNIQNSTQHPKTIAKKHDKLKIEIAKNEITKLPLSTVDNAKPIVENRLVQVSHLPIKDNKNQNLKSKDSFKSIKPIEKSDILVSNTNTIPVANTPVEPVKTVVKPKNFVDSEMLLYSVENKQTIPKIQAQPKMVIIDFNKLNSK
ncbi:MAG: hypothetical protein JST62_01995 [Bacteroidetes bacterium]|nr:hypothetical protein [Bacteroidota bacterium]